MCAYLAYMYTIPTSSLHVHTQNICVYSIFRLMAIYRLVAIHVHTQAMWNYLLMYMKIHVSKNIALQS